MGAGGSTQLQTQGPRPSSGVKPKRPKSPQRKPDSKQTDSDRPAKKQTDTQQKSRKHSSQKDGNAEDGHRQSSAKNRQDVAEKDQAATEKDQPMADKDQPKADSTRKAPAKQKETRKSLGAETRSSIQDVSVQYIKLLYCKSTNCGGYKIWHFSK